MIGDNNHLAVGLLVSIPLMNYLRMESRHAIIRYGLLATMALTLFAVVGSYSRGALLALGAVSGYFWLKSSKKLISGMLLAIALVTAVTFMPASWIDRMNTIETYQQDTSADEQAGGLAHRPGRWQLHGRWSAEGSSQPTRGLSSNNSYRVPRLGRSTASGSRFSANMASRRSSSGSASTLPGLSMLAGSSGGQRACRDLNGA